MCSNSIPKTGTPDVPDSFSLGRSDLWAESSLDREFNTPRFSTFDHIVSAFEMCHTHFGFQLYVVNQRIKAG